MSAASAPSAAPTTAMAMEPATLFASNKALKAESAAAHTKRAAYFACHLEAFRPFLPAGVVVHSTAQNPRVRLRLWCGLTPGVLLRCLFRNN